VADPFVIACAHVREGCVVTQEKGKPNAATIHNVCDHFGVRSTDFEGFSYGYELDLLIPVGVIRGVKPLTSRDDSSRLPCK
jgi:hypothetical protein